LIYTSCYLLFYNNGIRVSEKIMGNQIVYVKNNHRLTKRNCWILKINSEAVQIGGRKENQMEKQVFFWCGDVELEGLIDKGDSDRGVVVTHPHPVYGGDMHSYVVESIVRAYRKKDYTTLRFNFRGVGNSQGVHDNGMGEQDDVRAAISHLSEMGIDKIDLAGYSFGAWVGAHAISSDTPVRNMVMVSPPIGFRDFKVAASMSCLKLVITGSRDDIAPAEMIEKMLPQWNADARLEIIEGADHFYAGHFERVESILLENL